MNEHADTPMDPDDGPAGAAGFGEPEHEEHVPWEEEGWELDIAEMLAVMPEVDPPPGFIEGVIDQRPQHGGRAAVGALAATSVVLVAIAVFGLVGPGRVELSLDWLSSRHEAVAEGLDSSGATSAALTFDALAAGDPDIEMSEPSNDPIEMPSDFEHQADLISEDLRQAIYSHGGETISVFEQPGRADFDKLGIDGMQEIEGVPVWLDEQRDLMIVETQDSVVAIVGLDSAQMASVLADANPSAAGSFESTVGALVAELGFPD